MSPALAWFTKEIMAQTRSLDRQISGLPENVGVVVRQSVLDILKEKDYGGDNGTGEGSGQ